MSFGGLTKRLEYDRTLLAGRTILVLAGGGSSEREVSLASGQSVYAALNEAGYNASLLVTGQDHLSIDATLSQLSAGTRPALAQRENQPGVAALELLAGAGDAAGKPLVFTTLHGAYGEDGIWQGMLELLDVPYVSAGVRGSAVAMDKELTKLLMERLAIPTPHWWTLAAGESGAGLIPPDVRRVVGKPVDQGSSVGVRIVDNAAEGWRELEQLAGEFRRILIEEYIAGKEVTAAVIGRSADPVALPLVMIEPTREFYDYTAKYTSGASNYTCPAPLDEAATQAIQDQALRLYSALNLEPYARIDCIVDEQGQAHFLEANTLPGFTVNSLLPKAARAAGLEFVELLEFLLCSAIERQDQKGARR